MPQVGKKYEKRLWNYSVKHLCGQTLFENRTKIYKIHSRKIYVRVKCPFPLFLEEHASNMRNSLKYFSLRGERRNVFFLLLCNIRPAYIVYVRPPCVMQQQQTRFAFVAKKGASPSGRLGRVPPPGYKWRRRDLEEGRRESADAKIHFTCSRDFAYGGSASAKKCLWCKS